MRLELEVTEAVLLGESPALLEVLRPPRALGGRIALADFSTGYSSLAYLRRFPLDKVKIDRSFGLDVPAEGIDTRAQLDALRAEGCAQGQGCLLGKPEELEGRHVATRIRVLGSSA